MVTNNAINCASVGVIRYDGAGSFAASTLTNHALLVGGSSNAITSLALTDGQLAIGSTGADPVAATLTAGTGVGMITSAAGSITINVAGGGLTWTVITGATQAAVNNNGYVCNNGGTLVVTLPATSAVGDIVAVTGMNNAVGWKIAQGNAANIVYFGSAATTLGLAGYLASTATRDTVHLLCITAGATSTWQVISSVGNISVF